jgi:inosine-uridine nucleoside N-ribohydrolase
MKQITETVEPPPGDADAVSFLIDVVQAKPGQITLVTIGPLTNVATAMQKSQAFTAGLRGVVMMGGTVACAGNITPAAEFNFWQDPEAADVVFRSGAPLTMVGLDVCHKTRLLPERLEERAAGGSELGRFVLEATAPWFKAMAANEGREGLHLYDSLAMAVAIDPSLIELDECYVEIDAGNGAAQGMSVAFQKPFQRLIIGNPEPNANVALDVAADRFSEVFNARVLDRI